jgi:hypothetical protein
MLRGGDDIHAVLAHGAESGGHHVCLWFAISSVHLVSFTDLRCFVNRSFKLTRESLQGIRSGGQFMLRVKLCGNASF